MIKSILIFALISALADRVYSDTNYRLNTPIKPKAYSIALTPYFDTNDYTAFTFDGEVQISFTTESATKQIKLHSEDLIYDASNISVINGASILNLDTSNPLEFEKNYTFAFINLEADLQVGVEYVLKISYRGPIRADLTGFFRNYYIEKGVKKWLGATQMESTHARKVFPCFDEPGLKATFTLSIDRLESYKPSLANTKLQQTIPLGNGYVREIFYPSPVMPTYLVAFLVSEFEGVERKLNGTGTGTYEFGIFTRPEALNQTDYPLDFGIRVLEALGDYFGIDYYSTDPNLKLDHVALVDFQAGAMENWGLITYREPLLLYVADESTPYYKYRAAQILAHESTHLWFGDLVTCHWWVDTWLNEGFANYFQDYITSLIEPEVGAADMLVTGSVWTAFETDHSPSSSPISHDVNSPEEISGHFSSISYQKAGSVIRMIHHLIGDGAFKLGLNSYLETNQFGSGTPTKMYEALEIGAKNYSALATYHDTTLAQVMSSWITQPGYPILDVAVNYEDETVLLQQKRFYIDSKYSSNETYKIPITFATQLSSDFENTKPAFIMKTARHVFTIPDISVNHSWVLLNVQETGLYRVNYDDHSWQLISDALRGDDRSKIHHLNRAKIVNDLFAFLYADVAKFDRLKNFLDLEFLSQEDDYSVWNAVIRGLDKLWHSYLGSDDLIDIQTYILRVLDPIVDKLGPTVNATDSYETLRNRMQVLGFACKLGHIGCIEQSVKMFNELRVNGTDISPSLRPVAYCYGLRYGNASDYDFLWNRMATTNFASEATIIADVLGCTSDEGKLRSYLVSMLIENSPIKTNSLMVPLTSVLLNYDNLHIVMDELQRNYTLWTTIFTTMDRVLSTVASSLHTEADFTEFTSFLSSCDECTEAAKASARSSLATARAVTDWANSHKDDILTSIRSSSAIIAPSMMLIIALTIFLETIQCFA